MGTLSQSLSGSLSHSLFVRLISLDHSLFIRLLVSENPEIVSRAKNEIFIAVIDHVLSSYDS